MSTPKTMIKNNILGKKWTDVFPAWNDSVKFSPQLQPFVTDGPLNNDELDFARQVENHPKIELHVHAEACVWANFYTQENLANPKFSHDNMPSSRIPFDNFSEFIKGWLDNLSFATHESFYNRLALAVAARQASQNIVYSEVHLSPLDTSLFRQRMINSNNLPVLNLEQNLLEFLQGLQHAEKLYPHTLIKVIFDIVTLSNEEEHQQIINILTAIQNNPLNKDKFGQNIIVGVGLGGYEPLQNDQSHVKVLHTLQQIGYKIDIHSGEQQNISIEHIQNIRNTIKPSRIGHGHQFVQQELLFPLHTSMCPLSNILTGCFSQPLNKHPLAVLYKNQSSFSINTDDPLLFGTTLTLEYIALRRAFGFDFDFFLYTQQEARKAAFTTVNIT